MLKRLFDICSAIVGILIFILPCILIILLVKLSSVGPVFHWSSRIGRFNRPFLMPKFRSMKFDTPIISTDKLRNPDDYITFVGKFLRKTSFDEIPQFISVLQGHMSIVGPRPALGDQKYLIEKRQELGIDSLRPGITGWAQVHGRDEIPIEVKIKLDYEYFQKESFSLDVKIIVLTIIAVVSSKNISH